MFWWIEQSIHCHFCAPDGDELYAANNANSCVLIITGKAK